MIAFALLLIQVVPAAPAPEAEAAPKPEPYAGSLREGRLELATLSKKDAHDEALELARRLQARVDLADAPEVERAESLYAIGLAHGRAGAFDAAAAGFRAARGLAGSSELGLDASYDSGTFLLRKAELLRLEVPEIREKLGLPPPAQPPAGPVSPPQPGAPAPKEPPDPLATARQAYLVARAELVDRWRADWRDEDTRANLELAQRRLRELDEIRRQREEQRKQEEQKKDEPDQQKPDQQKQDQQKQDPKEQDPQQDPQQQDQQNQDQQDPQQDQPRPEDAEEREGQESRPEPSKPREEMTMTPEEVQRLLDQLQRIEEQAEQVRAMLREHRRTPVKKDW